MVICFGPFFSEGFELRLPVLHLDKQTYINLSASPYSGAISTSHVKTCLKYLYQQGWSSPGEFPN